MARIRCIKPEFPQSESIGALSRDARLLFIQLWTFVDDAGRSRAASRMLASLLYPYDTDAAKLMDKWLAELETGKMIILYQIDGTRYLQITNWLKHQKIDRPSPSKIPPFVALSPTIANPREASRGFDADLGSGIGSGDNPPLSPQGGSNADLLDETEDGEGGQDAAVLPVAAPKVREDRGARLSADWNPGLTGADFARGLGLEPTRVFRKFQGYWMAKAGKDARKVDWMRTWQVWCETEAERNGTLPLIPPAPGEPRRVTPMSGGL